MNEEQQRKLADLLVDLRQRRDELKVQLHLGKTEAEDLWRETEEKWRALRSQLDRIESDAGDTAKDVGATTMLLAEEIKRGYERLRKLF